MCACQRHMFVFLLVNLSLVHLIMGPQLENLRWVDKKYFPPLTPFCSVSHTHFLPLQGILMSDASKIKIKILPPTAWLLGTCQTPSSVLDVSQQSHEVGTICLIWEKRKPRIRVIKWLAWVPWKWDRVKCNLSSIQPKSDSPRSPHLVLGWAETSLGCLNSCCPAVLPPLDTLPSLGVTVSLQEVTRQHLPQAPRPAFALASLPHPMAAPSPPRALFLSPLAEESQAQMSFNLWLDTFQQHISTSDVSFTPFILNSVMLSQSLTVFSLGNWHIQMDYLDGSFHLTKCSQSTSKWKTQTYGRRRGADFQPYYKLCDKWGSCRGQNSYCLCSWWTAFRAE